MFASKCGSTPRRCPREHTIRASRSDRLDLNAERFRVSRELLVRGKEPIRSGRTDRQVQRIRRLERHVKASDELSRPPVVCGIQVDPGVQALLQVTQECLHDAAGVRPLKCSGPQLERECREELQFDEIADRNFGTLPIHRLNPVAKRLRHVVGNSGAGVRVQRGTPCRASRRCRTTVSLSGSPSTRIDARNLDRSGKCRGRRTGGTSRATSLPRRRMVISSPPSARPISSRKAFRKSLTLTSAMVQYPLSSDVYTANVPIHGDVDHCRRSMTVSLQNAGVSAPHGTADRPGQEQRTFTRRWRR